MALPVRQSGVNPRIAFSGWTIPLKKTVDDTVFTVLDCETTGLDPKADDLTEVTAIKYRNNREIDRFTSLVKPGKPIPSRVEDLTGISNAMVQDAPPPLQVVKDLLRFIGPRPVLVGDYIGFDIAFLRNQLDKLGLGRFKDRFTLRNAFCTRTLASQALPGQMSDYRARNLASLLYLPVLPDHRAENDVRNAAAVFFELIRKWRSEGASLNTLHDLKKLQGPAWRYEHRPNPKPLRAALSLNPEHNTNTGPKRPIPQTLIFFA